MRSANPFVMPNTIEYLLTLYDRLGLLECCKGCCPYAHLPRAGQRRRGREPSSSMRIILRPPMPLHLDVRAKITTSEHQRSSSCQNITNEVAAHRISFSCKPLATQASTRKARQRPEHEQDDRHPKTQDEPDYKAANDWISDWSHFFSPCNQGSVLPVDNPCSPRSATSKSCSVSPSTIKSGIQDWSGESCAHYHYKRHPREGREAEATKFVC
jgi:hypothetical protein